MTHTFARIMSETRSAETEDEADECASRIRFVHVLRSRSLTELLRHVMANCQIEVPENRPLTTTGRSEDALGIKPSIYLFAGRALPTIEAQAACVVSRSALESESSSPKITASPFDTGGLHLGRLKLDWQNHNDGSADQSEYLQKHSVSFSQFTAYFAGFLRAYFQSPAEYWAAPVKPIDGAELTSGSDMRNWTFEIRCEERVSVAGADWFFDDEIHREYTALLMESGVDPLPVHYVPVATEVALTAENWSRRDAIGEN